MDSSFPLLSLYIFAPVVGMLAIFCLPSKRGDIIKTVAAAAAAVPLLIGLYTLFAFHDTGTIQYYESHAWISGLNVYYRLGIDGISAPLIILSGLVGFIAVIASWGIEKQVKGYFALLLLLLAGMNGVFCALDFFLFYVFWELMLLPMYFLIGIWGGPNRVYAAIKFFLYTMAGSVLMLIVLLGTWYWSDGSYTTDPGAQLAARTAQYQRHVPLLKEIDLEEQYRASLASPGSGFLSDERLRTLLAKHRIDEAGVKDAYGYIEKFRAVETAATPDLKELALRDLPMERTFDFTVLKDRFALFLDSFNFLNLRIGFATLMFIFLYVAFAIKVPVFPFHTWLPWAHVEAPTAISVILAGILLKMGVYGFFRLAYPIFPTAAVYFGVPIAILGVFNIIYGACCAMAQDDLKKIVAYSSVSHMGYCMLGLSALTTLGMTGAVLQMFNHGTSTAMLFILVGVIYDRAHHRDVNKFGGLASVLPVYAGVTTIALFASMGLPGLSGFISEILVFLGSFNSNMGSADLGSASWLHLSFQTMTVIAALGVILTAAYLLWMMQRVFFGPLNEKYKGFPDLSGRELFSLVPLVVVVIVLGIYPQPLINLSAKSVEVAQRHIIASAQIASAERPARLPAVRKAVAKLANQPAAEVQDSDVNRPREASSPVKKVDLPESPSETPGGSGGWEAQTAVIQRTASRCAVAGKVRVSDAR